MKRLLLDINVVLDILLDRKPHVSASSAIWAKIELGEAVGLFAAHGVTTVFYLVEREHDARIAREAVEAMLQVVDVAPVDGSVIRSALRLSWPDFEDAVCAVAALNSRCDAIVTRDPSGFPGSPVPVMEPEAVIALLAAQ